MTGNVVSTAAQTSTTTSNPGVTSVSDTGLSVVVDNLNRSYYVRFNTYQSNVNLMIRGARITYIVNKAD